MTMAAVLAWSNPTELWAHGEVVYKFIVRASFIAFMARKCRNCDDRGEGYGL